VSVTLPGARLSAALAAAALSATLAAGALSAALHGLLPAPGTLIQLY
jgi:hypothetical protein